MHPFLLSRVSRMRRPQNPGLFILGDVWLAGHENAWSGPARATRDGTQFQYICSTSVAIQMAPGRKKFPALVVSFVSHLKCPSSSFSAPSCGPGQCSALGSGLRTCPVWLSPVHIRVHLVLVLRFCRALRVVRGRAVGRTRWELSTGRALRVDSKRASREGEEGRGVSGEAGAEK